MRLYAQVASHNHGGAPFLGHTFYNQSYYSTDWGAVKEHTRASDGTTFVVAGRNDVVHSDVVEVRAWDDLRLLRTLALPRDAYGASVDVEALALSPDGRWLAIADAGNRVYVVDYHSGHLSPSVRAGEWTGALAFAPSGRLLASACSYQGGANVRIDRLLDEGVAAGSLIPHDVVRRSELGTPESTFVDTLSAVTFSPSGQRLALFETSRIYVDLRPPGWRGDIVLYDVESGTLRWCASIDATVTGDARSLKEVGHGMGFDSSIHFVDEDHVLCGGINGMVPVYRTDTGTLVRRLQFPTDADVHPNAQDGDGTLWVVFGNGVVLTIPQHTIL